MAEQPITLRACDDAAALWCDVDTGNSLVMTLEFVLQLEGVARLPIQLNTGILGHSQGLAIRRERVVGNGPVEQMVYLGRRHFQQD